MTDAGRAALLVSIAVMAPSIYRAIPKSKKEAEDVINRLGVQVKQDTLSKTAHKLKLAGSTQTPEEFHGTKLGLDGLGLLSTLIWAILGLWYLGPLLAGALYFYPDLRLNRQINERRTAIRKDMSTFLMFFSCALAAGADQRKALKESAIRLGGPIKEEIETVLLEVSAGKPISEAMFDMAERTDLDEMRAIAKTISQSMRYGSSLAEDMKEQAAQMRTARRYDSMEAANKLTVKLIFPVLIFMLLPCLIAIGFPAAVVLLEAFK